PRASALVGRGWARLAQGDAPGASDDFLEAAATADNLRLVVAALWSGALAHERAGRDDEAMRLRRRAGELERVRASASGRDPFDGVARVPAYEEHAVAAVQHAYALEVALRSEDFEAAALARRARCDALRLYVVHAEPDRSPWVHRAHDLCARGRDELAAECPAPHRDPPATQPPREVAGEPGCESRRPQAAWLSGAPRSACTTPSTSSRAR